MRRYRTTMVHRWMWFPKVARQQKSGCKQATMCREFLSLRNDNIATHVQEMSGLCKYLKIRNVSQVENKVLTQVNQLRLQQQYLMSPMDTEVNMNARERRLVSSGYCQPRECSPVFILKCELLGRGWRVVICFLKILFSDLTEALVQTSSRV